MRALRLALLATATFLAMLVFTHRPVQAEGGFRCGSHLVKNGETQEDIARKCGDPDATREWTETQTESIWVGNHRIERSVPITYAEWQYDFGRDRLIRYLTFVQGRLRDVRTGAYGH